MIVMTKESMYYGQANYGIFRCRGKIAPQTAHHHQQAAPYIIVIDNFNDARAFSSRQRTPTCRRSAPPPHTRH